MTKDIQVTTPEPEGGDREPKIPTSTVEKILGDREAAEDAKGIAKDLVKDYMKALNEVAASEYGKLVLRTLVDASGVFVPEEGSNHIELIRKSGERGFYLKYIRPYLKPEQRKGIEE